ncbi:MULTISPECIES: alpha-amylase family glycosyl hydrolase [Acidobacteriaceae]|uniref:alpha-amylase family glycosyl hydrolase n=1 Tax=Acidobacteriaceae TaxID=204434 RepID=UPI00131BAE0A|nr:MULTISPECIES: alpha-amylase family glycosyl hydrolase [Acidobacteriaceae]MDW5265672.1 alpha-amylase family glycosyl hydrolase [Edaphobacter sp.]
MKMLVAAVLALLVLSMHPFARAEEPSQQSSQAPVMTKIDPPNWWAAMPKPMLLVRGEHLEGAQFHVSDNALRIQQIYISKNGHWAELWLSASPAKPETISVVARNIAGSSTLPFTFAARRETRDGFAGFSSKDVMYLIMTDRFADGDLSNNGDVDRAKTRGWHGGDLRGITQHLDYLQKLGVTTVWITPVYQNHEDGSYHGYGATDMYAVDEHYGSLADLKTLATALHQRGMKLVLDTVPNHVGPAHPWVNDPPEPGWFHGTKQHHRLAQGDFKPLTDPHAPWSTQRDVTEGWFANILPDLNQEDPAVAQYLTQNAVWWIEEAGIDGLRIDTFPYVGRAFWHGYDAQLHALYPRLTTVGEVFNPDPTITSAFAGGVTRNGVDTGLDTPFDFPSYFALRDVFLQDAPMSKLADVWRLDALYPHPERLVPFLGNHDTTRFMSEPGATPAKLKLAFTVLLTMRGMPEIYSGDEIAMTGGADPDNRHDFPGGFADSTQPSAFDAATRTAAQKEMHDWVKGLLDLRHSHTVLQTGEEQVLRADTNLLIYVRGDQLQQGCAAKNSGERVLVVVNKADQPQTITLPEALTALEQCSVKEPLRGTGASFKVERGAERGIEGDTVRIVIPANASAIASFD